jgi:hypothetical protein
MTGEESADWTGQLAPVMEDDFLYVVFPSEEDDYNGWVEEIMNTAPYVPLAAVDVGEQQIYINKDEYWGLVSDAFQVLEDQSSDKYDLHFEVMSDKAQEAESLEEYWERLENHSGIEAVGTDEIEDLVPDEEITSKSSGGTWAEDVVGPNDPNVGYQN